MATATARRPKTDHSPAKQTWHAGEVTLARTDLLAAMRVAARVTPRRGTLPELGYALLKHVNGRVYLRATDLDTEYEVTLRPTVPLGADFEVLIPVRPWIPLLHSLEGDEVVLSFADGEITLQTGTAKITEPTRHPSGFPLRADFEAAERYVVPGQVLKTALQRTTYATADFETRPILSSIYMAEFAGRKSLMSADGFRLAVAPLPGEGSMPDVNLPGAGMRFLTTVLGDDLVGMGVNPQRTRVGFAVGADITVTMCLVQGNFPNLSQLIPPEHTTAVTVPAPAMLRVAKALEPIAREGSGIMRFTASPEGFVVTVRGDSGIPNGAFMHAPDRIAEVRLLCPVEGEPNRIALQYRYVGEAMRAIGAGESRWEWTESSRQVVIRNVSDPGHLQVVMPMFVQWGD